MFINDKRKIIISVPMKCGTETFAEIFQNDRHWIDIYKSRTLDDIELSGLAKTLKVFELTGRNFEDYTHYVIVRHPVDWLVSGFRFLQSFKQNRKLFQYHTNFYKHLKDVKKEREQNTTVFNLFWSDHCSVMPDRYCDKNALPRQIEKLDDFLKELNIDADIPVLNKTSSHIPYPAINNSSRELLKDICLEYCEKYGYTIQ